MVKLEFLRRPGTHLGWEARKDFSSAKLVELQFHCFLGDIRISDNHGVVFETRFGSVGLLDIASAMRLLTQRLATQPGAASFDYRFKQSNDWISSLKLGQEVFLACSFAPGIARAPMSEFDRQTQEFLRETLAQLVAEYPTLALNREIVDLQSQLIFRDTSTS